MLKIDNSVKLWGACVLGSVAAAATVAGCSGGAGLGSTANARTVFGPPANFGAGAVRSFLTSSNGAPIELGIEIDTASLANPAALPNAIPPAVAAEVQAQMPPEAFTQTPFLSAALFYTLGHPPVGQQDVPHIHPAWFTVPDSTRFQILPGDPRIDVPVPSNEFPPGYITPPDPTFRFIPTLGNIFFNPAEAGYSETPFKTALSEYRYFNGSMTLIALGTPNTFLVSKGSLKRPMGVPAKYPKPGNYPTTYSIRFDASRNVSILAIGDFVARS